MNVLNPRSHGYLDYAVVPLLVLAPMLFGFEGLPATTCYVLAAVHLGMTLLTAFPLGLVKIIPFPVHGALELAAAVGLVLAPWLLGFQRAEAARWFYVVAGVAEAAVWVLTRYRTTPAEAGTTTA